MATIDLGKIKLVWRGTYNNGTAYVVDDVVEYTDTAITSSYICTAASTGNAPSSGGTAHASWDYLAKGAAGSPTTTRGDIIYRGASADARLAKGSSGQVLKMGANDPAWAADEGGKVEKVYQFYDDTQVCPNDTTSGSNIGSEVFSYTITAATANPYYLLDWSFQWGGSNQGNDKMDCHAIAYIENASGQLVYKFGFKKSSGFRANATFRGKAGDYMISDSDAGFYSNTDSWGSNQYHFSCGGNQPTADAVFGKCGDDSTQSVAAGQTLYLKGRVGNCGGSYACYNRTKSQVDSMNRAFIRLTELSAIA